VITEQSTSRFVDADGVRVHVHDAGSGPVLVCIHGGAPGAYGWGNFGQNVEALSQHFRVLVVDLPGYGKSEPPHFGDTLYASYARTIRAALHALGIERAHILGMATGGAVAVVMAVDFPELVDCLVLVSAAGGLPLFTPMPSEGQKAIKAYYQGEGPSLERMRSYLEMLIYDPTLITDEIVQERFDASLAAEPNIAEGGSRRPPAEPVWKDLDRIGSRTLVVWGRDNRVQGYDNSLFMLNRIPNVEVHLYGKTGLWVPFERSDDFNRLLLAFLDPQVN
jgi:2-hydroxy-6-oxonona-2,4-dienedioate hydrolase/4,5:9,10-diseco-3-hydroxy-5,9,17-trioxoandrosta-1(10),2-diene-4-oate hydrolase